MGLCMFQTGWLGQLACQEPGQSAGTLTVHYYDDDDYRCVVAKGDFVQVVGWWQCVHALQVCYFVF